MKRHHGRSGFARLPLWTGLLVGAVAAGACEPVAGACAVCQSGAPVAAESPARGALTLGVDARAGGSTVARHRVDERRFEILGSYEITDRIGVDAWVPLLWRTVSAGGPGVDVVSLGDVETRARYLARRWHTWSLWLFGGVKWPTAPVGTDASGAPLPSALQPGCSAIGPEAGASAAWLLGDWTISAIGQILLPFSIREAPHPGDSVRLAAGAERALSRRVATRATATLRLETGGSLDEDTPDPDSGGAVLYVTTGAVLRPTPYLTASVDIAFPVVQAWFGQRRETPVPGATLTLHL